MKQNFSVTVKIFTSDNFLFDVFTLKLTVYSFWVKLDARNLN